MNLCVLAILAGTTFISSTEKAERTEREKNMKDQRKERQLKIWICFP